MGTTSYSLNELAEATGLQPRTIRSYISFGLLAGPESAGRGASYSESHRRKLLMIRALKEGKGMRLEDIRRLLMTLSEAEGDQILADYQSLLGRPEPASLGSALDYLQSIPKAAMATGSPARTSPSYRHTTQSPVERLAERMEGLMGRTSLPRKAKGDLWFRVPVTPDLELAVRGEPSPVERARWERIADQIRQLLIGGSEDEMDSRV